MLQMHDAAMNGNWDIMDSLDDDRTKILDSLSTHSGTLDSPDDQQMTQDILRLDQEILFLTNQQLEYIAEKVTVTTEKSKACNTYQAHASNF